MKGTSYSADGGGGGGGGAGGPDGGIQGTGGDTGEGGGGGSGIQGGRGCAACATKSLDSVATVWVWLTRIPKSSLPGIGMQSLPHCDRIAVRRFDEAEPSSMMAW